MSAADAKLKAAYAMPESQRVDELAKALLREYMHRKGYKRTLAKFDEENPRSDATISSRAVMNDTMQLGTITHRNKVAEKGKKHPAFGTIMELVCSHRLRKRSLHPAGSERADHTELIPRSDCDLYDSSDEELTAKRLVEKRNITIAEQQLAYSKALLEYEAAKTAKLEAAAVALAANADHSVKKAKKDKKTDKKKSKEEDPEKKSPDDINGSDNDLGGVMEGGSSGKKQKKDKLKKDKKQKKIKADAPVKIAFGKGFDPLAATTASGESGTSSLLLAGESNSNAGKSAAWGIPPGGLSNIPTVGLGGSSGANSAPVSSERPSFLAGDGMSLSGNRKQSDFKTEWEAPSAGSSWGGGGKQNNSTKRLAASTTSAAEAMFGSSPSRDNSGFIDDTYKDIHVSPDHFKKQYDPTATAQGVYARKENRTGSHGGGPASANNSVTSNPSTPTTTSPSGRRGSEGGVREGINPFSSPDSVPRRGGGSSSGGVGFTEVSSMPPNASSDDLEGSRRGASRRVKISFAE